MNERIAILTVLMTIGLMLPAFTFAQAKHSPTIQEMLSLKAISSPQISPDGRFIAYQVQETNWGENRFVQQLWLVNVGTGKSFQLTRGKNSSDGASWSPDGKWLAFVTERDTNESAEGGGKASHRQIWVMSPDGGEAWQLTKAETDVGEFHWSKDSKEIAFTASAPKSKASKDRAEKYGSYDVFGKDYQRNELWSVDVRNAEGNFLPQAAKRLISDESISVAGFAWSPDSTKIAFVAGPSPLLSSFGEQDIYVLQLSENNLVKKVVALPGPDFSPMFSPDGRELAFLTWLGQPDYFYANCHIAVVDLAKVLNKAATASSEVRDLTANFDENPSPLDWGPDAIYFTAYQKTNVDLFGVNPQTRKSHQITSTKPLVIKGTSFTRDFRTTAFVAEDDTHTTELYVSSVGSFSPKRLTDMTAQVKGWNLGSPEVISWKSQDGTEIQGVLYKPADYDPRRRYPLFVNIHGGPADMSKPTLSPVEYVYPVQLFLAKGALVLEPNYRGSAGYGATFRGLDIGSLGVGEMSDVMSGVDHLISQGIVDPSRMAAMGSSWGGYLSAFLETHTDRFRAISESSGMSDAMTEYVNTDITPLMPQFLHATPWDNPSLYAKTSPITTIKQAKTPILIQHGANDRRVPAANAYEFYRGLQDQKVESRLILYTGFGHGGNDPKPLRAAMQSNLDWFNHYIWNEPIPKDSPIWGTNELGADK